MKNVVVSLVEELQSQLSTKKEELRVIEGAIQGVNLLASRLIEDNNKQEEGIHSDKKAKNTSK